jgi:hypothetical protein
MSGTALEPLPWPLRRWISTAVGVFLAQVGLIWLLGERAKAPPSSLPFQTKIHLAADPWSLKQLSDLPTISDPTLFVLPNLHGFSGAAWLTFKPQEYPPANWTEDPRWLALNQKVLGTTFMEFVATNVSAPLLIANQSMPPSIISDVNVPNPPVPTQSLCRIEGDLARRPLLIPPQLPSWPSMDLLTNTVLQAAVDVEGYAFSTLLLVSCGLKEADQFAMDLVTAARFQPLAKEKRSRDEANQLTWGKIIFQWHSLPPLPTNGAPVQP